MRIEKEVLVADSRCFEAGDILGKDALTVIISTLVEVGTFS